MCKKFVYQLVPVAVTVKQGRELLAVNDKLHHLLRQQKNMITDYFKSKKWDKYKKHSNSYELIFTSCHTLPSIANYTPISRSYFKLWETLHDFESIIKLKNANNVKALFLAEGPGGFIEAFCNYRSKQEQDQLYGMTLISTCKNVPLWKVNESLLQERKIKLLSGVDGTGSLYNQSNVNYLKQTLGMHSCDLITADGGFDFSADFNSQEELSMKLIAAEIKTAIQLQKIGGTFILKIFDIHSHSTIKLISILKKAYTDIFITKPFTSRPANSEKYLVCTNFFNTDSCLIREFDRLEQPSLTDLSLIQTLVEYNNSYILKQCTQISKTLIYINLLANDEEKFKMILKEQIRKALRWCFKYNIPISQDSIKHYKKIL